MEINDIIIGAFDTGPIELRGAVQGREYHSDRFVLPDNVSDIYWVDDIKDMGLGLIMGVKDGNPNSFSLVGTPKYAGVHKFTLNYQLKTSGEDSPIIIKELLLSVQPNARALWRNIETPKDIDYYKEDTYCEYVKVEGCGAKDMVGASRRGRSHAQEGRPRDDHFRLAYCEDSKWYVMAVADGAGSAKYSRQGSKIACETVVDRCRSVLSDSTDFDSAINEYQQALSGTDGADTARKAIGDRVYRILGNAAYQAHKNINAEAAAKDGAVAKDYATTLLLAICKKFDFGWFIATFWVGDGAICLYDRESHTATLLGVPDEGEFSGQTRFLTMPEIFADPTSLYKRLRVEIRQDFTALMLMSDGVSDPMFGTDVNLKNSGKWDEFWEKLIGGFPEDEIAGVGLTDNNEGAKYDLLDWLNFWAIGEHDDRTIAILY